MGGRVVAAYEGRTSERVFRKIVGKLVDGAGVEFGREESFDLGKLVEPGKNGFGLLMTSKAGVELVADGVRGAADFAIGSGGE